MISTSELYKKELYDAEHELQCTIDLSDGTIVELTDDDIVQGSFTFKESAVSGSFTVGGMVADQVDMTLYIDIDNLYLLIDAIVTLKVVYTLSDGTSQTIPIGKMYVDASTVKRSANCISFSAFNAIVRFDKSVSKGTMFNCTIAEFVKNVCKICNVEFDENTLDGKKNTSLMINFKTSQVYTYRELLSFVLQLMGSFGRINRATGKFEIINFSDSVDFEINEDNAVSRDVSDSVMSVTGIKFNDITAGTDGYVIDLSSNPILASYVIVSKDKDGNTTSKTDSEKVSDIISETLIGLNGVEFCNANVTWFGDLSVQAGDCFNYTQDGLYGGDRKIIVMEQEHKLNGTSTIKSYGTNKAVMYSPFNRIEQSIVDVKGDYDQVMGEAITIVQQGLVDAKKDLDQAVKDATDQITGNKGGYVIMRPSEHPSELLIMDTDNIDTATNVWRWNKSGLGFSSTGYNGTYGIAITQDGQIVANYITAGTLEGSIIKAGTITANSLSVGTKTTIISNAVDQTKTSITNELYSKNGTFYSAISKSFVTDDSFENYKSTIKQTNDKIQADVTSVTSDVDGLKQDVAKIKIESDEIMMTVKSESTSQTGTTYVLGSKFSQTSSKIKFTASQFAVDSDSLLISDGKISSQYKANGSIQYATVINKGILRVRQGDRNTCIMMPYSTGNSVYGCYGSSKYGDGIVFGAMSLAGKSSDDDSSSTENWQTDSVFYKINFGIGNTGTRHEFTGKASFSDAVVVSGTLINNGAISLANGALTNDGQIITASLLRVSDRLRVNGRFIVCDSSGNTLLSADKSDSYKVNANCNTNINGVLYLNGRSSFAYDTNNSRIQVGQTMYVDGSLTVAQSLNVADYIKISGNTVFGYSSGLRVAPSTTFNGSSTTFNSTATFNDKVGFHGSSFTTDSSVTTTFNGSVKFNGSVSGLPSASYPSSVSLSSLNVSSSATFTCSVDVKSSLSVAGTVHPNSLVVDNNARIDGQLKMGSAGVVALQYDTSLNALLRLGNTNTSLSLVGSKISSNKSITVGSDRRIKNHIEDISDKYIDMVDLLSAKTYFLNDDESNCKNVGFIAQDVLSVLSDVGLTTKEFAGFTDIYNDGSMYGLVYTEFIPILWEYCKKLKKQIDELKGENK